MITLASRPLAAFWTTWVNGPDSLAAKEASPEYAAFTTWFPALRPDSVRLASWRPPTVEIGAVPSTLPPSVKVTVPVGTPGVGIPSFTTAVSVTSSP
jgi:hypothetical protein